MIIKLDKDAFESLTVDSVGHACFAPMVPVYQKGMRERGTQSVMDYRIGFLQTLSQGQQALLMFFSYYDHAARSEEEFQGIGTHYFSAGIFGGVKRSAEYFCDDEMLDLLSNIELALAGNSRDRLADLYHRLCEISPATLVRIGNKIKENPAEFVYLE